MLKKHEGRKLHIGKWTETMNDVHGAVGRVQKWHPAKCGYIFCFYKIRITLACQIAW